MNDEAPKFPVDIHTEEFRNKVYNEWLRIMEQNAKFAQFIKKLDNTIFEELTPEVWMEFVAYQPLLKEMNEFLFQVINMSPLAMDSPDTMDRIGEMAARKLKEDKEGS